jgi:cleavage stimulation factor subunit 3
MADDEAEAAFLQEQATPAEPQVSVEEEDVDGDNSDADSDEYDPSQALGEQYSVPISDSNQPEEGPVDASVADDEEDSVPNPIVASETEADQSSDFVDPSQNPSRADSSMPMQPSGAEAQPKTRTIGGFEVDDEDDQGEADYEPPAVLGGEDADAMPVTMSEDPSSGIANQNTSPDVSSHTAEQTPASGPDVANSSYSPAPVSNIDPFSVPVQSHWAAQDLQSATMQNSTTSTPVPDSPASKGRLAHDRVGMLEDRIQKDPRGDIPAWLELIAEHRGRGRLDIARETYERFFEVFPMAVSSHFLAFSSLFSFSFRTKRDG